VAIIVAARTRFTGWSLDPAGNRVSFERDVLKYHVHFAGLSVLCGVDESYLRALDDREALSTWAEFAKVTGLDLPGSCLVAKPVQRGRKTATSGAGAG
jgi:hypothetical protein